MNEQRHEMNGSDASQISNGSGADQLFWTAAQYAAGDLSEAAVEEFEARLEGDQSAREALAQVVALAQAVVQIESTPVVPAQVEPFSKVAARRSFAAVWIAVAASIAVAFFAYRIQQPVEPRFDAVAGAPTLAQQELALAWADGQIDDETIDLIGEAMAGDPMFDEELDDALTSSTTDPSAPDWLLAAVADAAATGGN